MKKSTVEKNNFKESMRRFLLCGVSLLGLMNKFLNFVMELFCYGILMPINKILLTNCKIVEGLKENFDYTIDSQEQNSTPLVKS